MRCITSASCTQRYSVHAFYSGISRPLTAMTVEDILKLLSVLISICF
jgi:hypothetical protein